MPPTRPTRKASVMLRVFAGRDGAEGIMAGSTMRMLEERKPSEMAVSFNLVIKPSYNALFASASRRLRPFLPSPLPPRRFRRLAPLVFGGFRSLFRVVSGGRGGGLLSRT